MFPISHMWPLFPKHFLFGLLTKEGEAFIVTGAGKWQESSVEADTGVTSICEAGSKVIKPSRDRLLGRVLRVA